MSFLLSRCGVGMRNKAEGYNAQEGVSNARGNAAECAEADGNSRQVAGQTDEVSPSARPERSLAFGHGGDRVLWCRLTPDSDGITNGPRWALDARRRANSQVHERNAGGTWA